MEKFLGSWLMLVVANTKASLRRTDFVLLLACVSILMFSPLGVCQEKEQEFPPQVRYRIPIPFVSVLLPPIEIPREWEPWEPPEDMPPKPLAMVVLSRNLTGGQPNQETYWDNLQPLLGQTVRFQVVIYASDGFWYTGVPWNPRGLQGVYFDARDGWTIVATGYLVSLSGEISLPSPLSLYDPYRVREWRWRQPKIVQTLKCSHQVDDETTFSRVTTDSRTRYYIYTIEPSSIDDYSWNIDYTWRDPIGNYIRAFPGQRISVVKFRLRYKKTIRGRAFVVDTLLYAGPIPGARESAKRDDWHSNHNQWVESIRASHVPNRPDPEDRESLRWAYIRTHFHPIYVRPCGTFLRLKGSVGHSSNAARELVICALSMCGIPYEWGGKGTETYPVTSFLDCGYSMRASDQAGDPRGVAGNHGFGLDCSGLLYQAILRAYMVSVHLNPQNSEAHYY